MPRLALRSAILRATLATAAMGVAACTAVLGIDEARRPDPTEPADAGAPVTETPEGGTPTQPSDAGAGRRGWVQVFFEVIKNPEALSPNVRADKTAYSVPENSPPLPFKAAAYSEGALYGGSSAQETRYGNCSVLEVNKALQLTDRPFFGSVEISSPFCPETLKVRSYQTTANPLTVQVASPGGQTVSFSASNGSVPGFGIRRLIVPRPIIITSPSFAAEAGTSPRVALDRSAPLRITWTGGTQGKVRTTLYASEEPGNAIQRVELYCDTPAAAGSVDIPVAALARLPGPTTAGVTTRFFAQLYQVDEFASGDYDVTLNILSPVEPTDTADISITR